MIRLFVETSYWEIIWFISYNRYFFICSLWFWMQWLWTLLSSGLWRRVFGLKFFSGIFVTLYQTARCHMLISWHQYILPVTSVVLFIGALCHGNLLVPSTAATVDIHRSCAESGLCVPRKKSETMRKMRRCKERQNTEQASPSGVHFHHHHHHTCPYKTFHVLNHGGLL